jgi:DNA-binding MarR family transcriptional regulator
MAQPVTVDERELAEQLRAVIGRLVRSARQVDTVPAGEAAVLGELARGGPQSTAQLAERRKVRHQSIAKIVSRLDAAELVAKVPHATDRRTTLLSITPLGLAALSAERSQRSDWLAGAIHDELGPAERQRLAESVALLDLLADHA